MTNQAHSFSMPARLVPGRFRRFLAHFCALNAAYQARQWHLTVTERDLKDIAKCRDDAVGYPAYQRQLPFFMQHDFQAHRL